MGHGNGVIVTFLFIFRSPNKIELNMINSIIIMNYKNVCLYKSYSSFTNCSHWCHYRAFL